MFDNLLKPTIILFLFLINICVLSQEVVSSQGDSYISPGGFLDFTVGEVIINTDVQGAYILSQGFHQTNWDFVGIENHDPNYDATVFPNPTSDLLNIRASIFDNVSYTLYDSKGKLLIQNNLSSEQTQIQVSQLASGLYSLILSNKTQNLKTFLLIKQQ
tara:strand:+ start:65 stop:541 length:477 start_codon:yes stop_codon:yes gene_type:complete